MSLSEQGAAAIRSRRRKYAGTKRDGFYNDYLDIGMLAEEAFAKEFGVEVDYADRDGGDGGVDFFLPGVGTVDVKGMLLGRKFLAHEVAKPVAQFYALYEVDAITGECFGVGWARGAEVLAARQGKLRIDGYLSHLIHRADLHPMSELHAMSVRK